MAVAFGTARLLFLCLKLPAVSVEGLGVAVAALPNPSGFIRPQGMRRLQHNAGIRVSSGWALVGCHQPTSASQENSIVLPLGSPTPHGCGPVGMGGNHQFADASPNPVLSLLGGLQNLPMSWGFWLVSKGSVLGQWWCVLCRTEKTPMFFMLCDKIKKGRAVEIVSKDVKSWRFTLPGTTFGGHYTVTFLLIFDSLCFRTRERCLK